MSALRAYSCLILTCSCSFKHSLKAPTNFAIKLGSFVWNVHAELLATKSDFFKKITEGSRWKVCHDSIVAVVAQLTHPQENQERCVELHDDNPWMLARMLLFLYYASYTYHH